MKIFNWLKTKLTRRHAVAGPALSLKRGPLREFVYLDEVSLRSLLSSQAGEMTESKSQQSIDSLQSELSGKASVEAPLVAKTEINSRFQTSNSSTLQTSRKATVQSWFRDLLDINGLCLMQPPKTVPNFKNMHELHQFEDKSIVIMSSQMRRGELIEVRVKLAADPVFHLGTMVSEMSGIAEDFPNIFKANGGLESIRDAQMINKLLHKLLAGLIPIRAEAVHYAVIEIEGVEYVTHKQAITDLDIPHRSLFIVGVTEHLAYWKDIRRVLFSEAEFTVLCRISRSDLQLSWTPVKLADLFSNFTPDLVAQINTASLASFSGIRAEKKIDLNELRLVHALQLYKADWLTESGKTIDADAEAQIDDLIATLMPRAGTATGQRSAFKVVAIHLANLVNATVDPSRDSAIRDNARTLSGLLLIPALAPKENSSAPLSAGSVETEPRLLDVEIVAIYW